MTEPTITEQIEIVEFILEQVKGSGSALIGDITGGANFSAILATLRRVALLESVAKEAQRILALNDGPGIETAVDSHEFEGLRAALDAASGKEQK